MASTSDTALKAEIARLTGAINQHKFAQQRYQPYPRSTHASTSTRDVVIDGVTFESSSRSLVRKSRESQSSNPRNEGGIRPSQSLSFPVPKPPHSSAKVPFKPIPHQPDFPKTTNGHRPPPTRAYKPKVYSHTQSHRPRNRNMTLDNIRGPVQGRRANKRMKYLNKPCPRFTTTDDPFHGCPGACSRGLTCMYQHDPNKIAICWNFLHGNCPNTAESCNLSHDPIPERTPLCVHFANNGRCTRENCPFPHVRVGQRHGVCRDFAVLGYCSKGLDCQMQHVRECPDFAEKGTCSTKGCKLPHVIRANRNRQQPTTSVPKKTGSPLSASETVVAANAAAASTPVFASLFDHSSGQLGEDFISLMFNESEDDDDDVGDEHDSDEEEGDGPTTDGSDVVF